MITQFKNKNYSYWSRVMILPVLVILFCAFVLRTQQSPTFSSANSVTDNEKSITILIDAGHGGEDAGARSNDGKFLEKDLALAIALKVKKHAAEYKNLNIVMTREADEYPKIKDRAEMAAIVKADMVISIHVSVQGPKSDNEYASDQKSGFEAYITGKEHQHKETSRKIAESILKNVAGIYATTPIIKQRSQGGIWMLDAVPCASVLIECGYMTNEKDLAFIIQPQNQEKVARHIIEGIVNYYATNDYSNNFSGNGTDTLPSPNNNKNINQNKNKQTHELSDAEIQALKMQQQELNKQFELLLAKQKELQLLQQNANAAQLEDLKRNELNIQKKLEVLVEKEHEFTRKEQNKKQEVVEKELAIQRQHQENIKQQQMEFELQQHHMQQAQLQEQKNHERMMQFEKEQRLMLEKQQELQALQQRLQEQQRMEELKKQQFLNEQMNQNKQQNGYQSDNQDSIPEGVTFTKVENPPSFPGGDKAWKKYVTKQIKYPVEAIEKGLSGTVIVQFIVEKNGELTEIETINNKGNALAAESIRVIKESGKWIPATQNGHIVRAYHKQPIVFKLSRG